MARPGDRILHISPYSGKTIDEVATTERGLLWLDKMLGVIPKDWAIYPVLLEYMSDPTIVRELNEILDSRE